jgi:hypothetical protein
VGRHLLYVLGGAVTSSMKSFRKEHSQPAVEGTDKAQARITFRWSWAVSISRSMAITIGTNCFHVEAITNALTTQAFPRAEKTRTLGAIDSVTTTELPLALAIAFLSPHRLYDDITTDLQHILTEAQPTPSSARTLNWC